MKRKTLSISIPEPCHENCENMTPNEQGRHCSSCNKTIIDFSLYSDRQLIDFIEKAQGKICGRLSLAQVSRPISYTQPRNHFLHKLLFGTALTIGISCSANANYNPAQKPLIEQYDTSQHKQEEENLPGDTNKRAIKGTVINVDDKKSLPFANVILSFNNVRIGESMTDIDGNYSFHVPDSLYNSELTISTYYAGYTDLKRNIILSKANLPKDLTLKLKSYMPVFVGIIYSTPVDGDPTHQVWRKGDTPIY